MSTKLKWPGILVLFIIFISACATSMTPTQVYTTLPTLTHSECLKESDALNHIQAGECKYMVKGRTYAAPQGLTVQQDLKYAAKGIDEWVSLDDGNAYVLTSFNWKSVGDMGGTQLFVEFDTVRCN